MRLIGNSNDSGHNRFKLKCTNSPGLLSWEYNSCFLKLGIGKYEHKNAFQLG